MRQKMKYCNIDNPRLSINFHLTERCNAKCKYCYATFPHLNKNDELPDEKRLNLIDKLVDEGVGKINFAGGEPTLVKNLGVLCKRIKERSQGSCAVSLVTNGAKLEPLLNDWAEWIDWVALSVDSSDDQVNFEVGRTPKNRPYAQKMLELGDLVRHHGARLKCNTVVGQHNVGEDMHNYISRMNPERWKLFQALPIRGENDGVIEPLLVSADEFSAFVERHERLKTLGIDIVPEDNNAMTNSYLMISPDGRFYWHIANGAERSLKYGPPILETGFDKALREVDFSQKKLLDRGGQYNWFRSSTRTTVVPFVPRTKSA